jgi:ParB family chromosome partitioning protein
MQPKKRALGRGLEALLPHGPPTSPLPPKSELPNTEPTSGSDAPKAGIAQLPLASIRRNPEQPRQNFDPEALAELTGSIQTHGVLQPIAVVSAADGYILVAGERRWRAAQQAGLTAIPAVVLEQLTEQEILECALVENL